LHRWKKNTENVLIEIDLEGMHWISLAPQDRDKWQAVVSKCHLYHQGGSDVKTTLMIETKKKRRGVVGHPVGTKFLSLYIMY
jgi:hypothetical protein